MRASSYRSGADGLDGDDLLKAARTSQPRGPHLRHSALGDGNEQLVATEHLAGRVLQARPPQAGVREWDA